jgi:hypothetical protein
LKVRAEVASVIPISERKFKIAYGWRVETDVKENWYVFVHFGAGDPIPFQNDHEPARPVQTWRAGELIDDGPFDVTIPENITAEAVEILMGLCRGPGGSERAKLPSCGGDRRVLVGRLRLRPTIAFEKVAPGSPLGDPLCFARADNGWAEGLCLTDRFLKNTHEVLSPLADLTAHARLIRLDFLTANRAVRRATFGEDAKAPVATVTVNFGPADFVAKSDIGGDVTLPTYGFLIESPTFVAFHATSWSGRRYERPVLFTIRFERGRARIFHGFGDAHITWHNRQFQVQRETDVAF